MRKVNSNRIKYSVICVVLALCIGATAVMATNGFGAWNKTKTTIVHANAYDSISEDNTVTGTMSNGTQVEYYNGTRDPWLWPFDSESIWNMPLGSSAVYTATRVFKDEPNVVASKNRIGGFYWGADIEYHGVTAGTDDSGNYVTDHAGKQFQIYNNTWAEAAAAVASGNTSSLKHAGKMYWPTDLTISASKGGNKCSAILQPDMRTIIQIEPTSKDNIDAEFVTGVSQDKVDLYGDGIIGTHWGSGLSSLGGTIRESDIQSTDLHCIRHALKLNIDDDLLFYGLVEATDTLDINSQYDVGDTVNGFCWPAKYADSGAPGGTYTGTGYNAEYKGTNPNLTMGSLLAIANKNLEPSDIGITTELGKKMFYALRDYGCYIVDNGSWDIENTTAFSWSVSSEAIEAANTKYDIVVGGGETFANKGNTNFSANTNAYCADMNKIIDELYAVVNNTPTSVGGGGTPCRPLAPQINRLESVDFATENVNIAVGGTHNLITEFTPSNATNKGVTYTSSNSEVATVSADGTVTGLSYGKAVITVTSHEGTITDTCVVYVRNGDINNDGVIDSTDYMLLKYHVDGINTLDVTKRSRADIDGDSDADADDLELLKEIITDSLSI